MNLSLPIGGRRVRRHSSPPHRGSGCRSLLGSLSRPRSNSSQGRGQLAFRDLYGLSEEYLRTFVQRVYALKPEDIQRLARTYLDPATMAIVVVGDPAIREQLRPYE